MTREKTFKGEKEILENSTFPTLVDPAFILESEELYLKSHDGGMWLGFLPHSDAAVQLKLGAEEVLLHGDPLDPPLEEWVKVNHVRIEEITVKHSEVLMLKSVELERYYDESPVIEQVDLNPFA